MDITIKYVHKDKLLVANIKLNFHIYFQYNTSELYMNKKNKQQKITSINKIHNFFTKFSEIIPDKICHHQCKF